MRRNPLKYSDRGKGGPAVRPGVVGAAKLCHTLDHVLWVDFSFSVRLQGD